MGLCNLNLQYINLAKKMGASVHTIRQDINNLAEINEGEILNIEKINNKLNKLGVRTDTKNRI